MHSGVYTLLILNLDRNRLAGAQMSALRRLDASSIRPQYIRFLACGNQLLELAEVVGMDLPTRLFVAGTANLHGHTVYRPIVRPPDAAEDYPSLFSVQPL